jgi:proteasome alpha subunit
MPFYVSPERGKSSVTLEYADGVLLMAENPSSLSKIGEIYDRIAFAGGGQFSEFDQLRKVGVRYADVKGYAYSRDDVRAKALANAYSQAMGDVFTRELKPLEVEVIVAEVGDDELAGHEKNAIFRVQFDGSISDHDGYCVIGGAADEMNTHLSHEYKPGMPLGDALRLGRTALQRATDGEPRVELENLEVCVLERARAGRKFRRLTTDIVVGLLGA